MKTVYLDLDDTLIKTYLLRDLPRQHFSSCVPADGGGYSVYRPGLKKFLEDLMTWSDVRIFTAASIAYAKSILDPLSLDIPIHSSEHEKPNSLKSDSPWVLCDNLEYHLPKSQYKLRCLGDTDASRYILVRNFTPHLEENDNELNVLYHKILEKLR